MLYLLILKSHASRQNVTEWRIGLTHGRERQKKAETMSCLSIGGEANGSVFLGGVFLVQGFHDLVGDIVGWVGQQDVVVHRVA